MPKLVSELKVRFDLKVDDVGAGPFGHRYIANVTGGTAEGKFRGKATGAGADWLLVDDKGIGRLDVRLTVHTDDGAYLYVQYSGIIEVTEAIGRILGGAKESTEFGDQYFFTNPRLETGDERYSWVNRTFFIGQGRLVAGPVVEYNIFRVEN